MNENTRTSSGKPTTPVKLRKAPHVYEGYAYGLRQPSLAFELNAEPLPASLLDQVDEYLFQKTGLRPDFCPVPKTDTVTGRFIAWSQMLLDSTGHPVLEAARIINGKMGNPIILLPCTNHSACSKVLHFLLSLLNTAGERATEPQSLGMKYDREFEHLRKALKVLAPQGFNARHFLLAATQLKAPWIRLWKDLFQFGQGKNSRLLDSSLTDRTPAISVGLVRNKRMASEVMRMAGLPVAPQGMAGSEQEALAFARRVGFPVVVKPIDKDGGRGVFANLNSDRMVSEAFAEARKFSQPVLVEKHVPGKDYRLHMVHNEVHAVLERVPGGITGNGTDSIRTLLDRQNHERRTARDDRRYLHEMDMDKEANDQLAAQKLSWDAIPKDGQFIRLRGAANVASGGIPVPVPVEEVHPDNLMLARRITEILRLDIAGVDLLIPDIRHSWLETGAYICEVNAQPQMFSTMHLPMLQSLLNNGDGRIPVVVVLSNDPGETISTEIQQKLVAQGCQCGLARSAVAWSGKDCISKVRAGCFAHGRMLLQDPTIEALVISACDNDVIHKGWPVDQCDVVLIHDRAPGPTGDNGIEIGDLMRWAEPLAPRHLIVDSTKSQVLDAARQHFAGA